MPKHAVDSFMSRVKEFIRSEVGPTATEYAVMLALIIVVAIVTITSLGVSVNSIWAEVHHQVGHTID